MKNIWGPEGLLLEPNDEQYEHKALQGMADYSKHIWANFIAENVDYSKLAYAVTESIYQDTGLFATWNEELSKPEIGLMVYDIADNTKFVMKMELHCL